MALRVDDMDGFVAHLAERGVAVEAGPFDPPLEFDRPLAGGDSDVFAVCGDAGAQLRIMFFRGPGGERFEAVQDNIKGALGRRGCEVPAWARACETPKEEVPYEHQQEISGTGR